jgi:hypothetical protein
MSPRKISWPAKPAGSIRRWIVLGATALAMAIVPAGVAHASWYITKSGAERQAKLYVSQKYSNTYFGDLTTYCRPQGHRYADSRYMYHRFACGWYDSSDDTSGSVLIVGSRNGAYGKVLVGAH